MSKLLRGTFILTLGTYISKFLGLIYIIPFFYLVGEHGTALYNYGYVPYTIFISIATAGIPASVAKFISKYNEMEEYAVGRRLFKYGSILMIITGVLSFLALYALAPFLADLIVTDEKQISNPADVVAVIRAISFALIIVPFMAIFRGFFQGYQSMGPSAVSQVIEQVVRIAFLLSGAFVVIKIMDGEIVQAVQVATFSAFVGAIGGLAILLWYWVKRKPYLNEMLKRDRGKVQVSVREIYREILISAIPFIIVGIAIPLFQEVDTLTFNRTMASMGKAEVAENYLGILNVNANKLINIPLSLAIAFSTSLVPMITSSFTRHNIKLMRSQISQTFQVLLFLTLPATVGIMVLAEPLYTLFYGASEVGTSILMVYAPCTLFFSFFFVTASILQGLNMQKFAVFSLLVGLLIKMVLNIPFIKMFETYGAIYTTMIGFAVVLIINLWVIRQYAYFRYRLVFRRGLLISILSIIMGIVTGITYGIFNHFISPATRFGSIILCAICIGVAVVVYFYMGIKTKLMHRLFPEMMRKMERKFGKKMVSHNH